MGLEEDSEQPQVDVFDLLPDALVLEIFNRVQDARSLSACTILCKRFGDLVTQTHNVSLEIARRNKLPEFPRGDSGLHMNKSKGFVGRFILKPIHALFHRMVSRKSKSCSHCSDDEEDNSFRLPNELLNNFKEIRSLAVKLPGLDGDVSSENGSGALLKWKAEFGKELESCVILGATGFRKSEQKVKNQEKESGKDGEISPFPASMPANLTNKQLKKRVVWTISCLIASSARHHMLKQIIALNRMIRDVKISDGSKQGTIEMTERQVVELRKEMNSTAVVEPERTEVPAVTIKMWYVPVLELPESGCVMKGATLAVIRPAVTAMEKDDDVSLAMGAFEEKCMGEAVRKLIDRKKSYTLEMNSF
ncbi:F-box protein At1g22220-like [Cynara cardunculus var. scolymus]|uniref:F-box domain, cyclin-like protein n=1 Tax=Cynara cardunculus var. scolymus TaxID=59895 RepID=A0A103YF98_CYNCS|nr:F-box protein At1g22220-like [Cynara cardunculus var. scolymus]KVI08022.1 F-box domain, cyclin-like protein [Cynara cardunculus var. scolymus]